MSRPQCPSVCHQFTLCLGHMWNDHLNSSVVYKTCVNSCRHFGRRNTLLNIHVVANVPLTLHTHAELPWYGNSL